MPRLQAHNAQAALDKLELAMPQVPVLGLCPGAEYGPAKRWPVEYFAQVAQAYRDKDWQVWLFGSEKDADITRQINHLTRGQCLDLGGRTSLAEAIDLMALCSAVLSNDSGLMHVAAALDKSLVALYGSSDPGFTPPLSAKAKVVSLNLECSPCFQRECPLGHLNCLRELKPQQVLKAMATQQ